MVADRDRQATLAATQSRRILARLQAGVWDLLELLDLGPLETDPLIQVTDPDRPRQTLTDPD